MAILRWCAALALVLAAPGLLAAQAWGGAEVDELVRRAVARRGASESDPGLTRWEARARGMVLFLSRLGDTGGERLVKADELDVEVYWDAPGPGKQRIVAWRDRAWLPTDIRYHRDHLGIVTDDFGPVIRLGEGEEVRDVLHPLSAAGAPRYEFALADSVVLQGEGRTLTVHRVLVRPRDLTQPGVLGTLYLAAGSGALVRFRFSFTPASYRDATVEDITVMLESALQDGRFWLPWRQEIEIRRRAGVVDVPVRGVIRAEWQLREHRVGAEVAPRTRAGPAIGGLMAPGGDAGIWEAPLEAHLARRADAVDPLDRAELLAEVRTLAEGKLGGFDPPARLSVGALSDLLRVNRVEGVRVGVGMRFTTRDAARLRVSPWIGYGTANRRVSARLELARGIGSRGEAAIGASREVADFTGALPISAPLNSLLSQEFGVDRGDWVDHEQAWLRVAWQHDGGLRTRARLAVEQWHALPVAATPARGDFRPNPGLAAGRQLTLRLEVQRTPPPGPGASAAWQVGAETGRGSGQYLRLDGAWEGRGSVGPGELSLRLEAGAGVGNLPAPRQFALGGWGTLPGEEYRAFGGRWGALGRAEYLVGVPVPELRLGSFAGTGRAWLVGPFLAVGAAGGRREGDPAVPWGSSRGLRPIAGVAIEAFWRLVRVEVGMALRGGGIGVSADVARPWWGIL